MEEETRFTLDLAYEAGKINKLCPSIFSSLIVSEMVRLNLISRSSVVISPNNTHFQITSRDLAGEAVGIALRGETVMDKLE